jgi:hypothetical protein
VIPATVAASRVAKVNTMHKTATALADKPRGELQNTNALMLARFAVVSIRRSAEVISVLEVEVVVLGEAVT